MGGFGVFQGVIKGFLGHPVKLLFKARRQRKRIVENQVSFNPGAAFHCIEALTDRANDSLVFQSLRAKFEDQQTHLL